MAGTNKVSDAFRNLETNLTQSYRSGWDGYWGFVDRLARNPASFRQIQTDYLVSLSQSIPAQMAGVLEASTQCYAAILETGGQLVRDAYTRSSPAPAAASTAAPAVSEFLFEGFTGEPAARQFLVTNSSQSVQAIAFGVSDFQNESLHAVSMPVVLDPAEFSLLPAEEKVVTCTVSIPEGTVAGRDYLATMRATGLPGMNVRLRVRSLGVRARPAGDDGDLVILTSDD